MLAYKCKMCGGTLEISQEMNVCECQYCGSMQTLPKLNDERKSNLHDRAGHFRRNNEFDKAMSLYEQILNEDLEDSESYWSLVLCQYGIEYVEDPVTQRRVPTVNRAQFTSIFADENYRLALRYATPEQRTVYEAEAKEIEQIQKRILEISSKEEPFDIFICYKESDVSGRRTQDSVLATDLYHQLKQEGFKVFFSRITLEDKLGSAYEPYIFAALNSAKVMVVLGTKKEYFNAVWVRNEWNRYLALIKQGEKKVLIPAYRDMDPYELPDEFSYLQAQDMSKLGFMQDLIRGIKKIVGANEEKVTEEIKSKGVETTNSTVDPLLRRAFMFLEDKEFGRADELCEQVLNLEPENALAYVGKLMVKTKTSTREGLGALTQNLTEDNYFQKAIRFAEESLKKELQHYNGMILETEERIKQEQQEKARRQQEKDKNIQYAGATEALAAVKKNGALGGVELAVAKLDDAISTYSSILGWRDSNERVNECTEIKRKLCYNEAKDIFLNSQRNAKKRKFAGAASEMERAISWLRKIDNYDDVKVLLKQYEAQKDKYFSLRDKQVRSWTLGVMAVAILAIIVFFVVPKVNIAIIDYKIEKYAKSDEFDKLYEALEAKYDANSARKQLSKYIYDYATRLKEKQAYDEAIKLLLGDVSGNSLASTDCMNLLATLYQENKDYLNAIKWFVASSNSQSVKECMYLLATSYKEEKDYENAIVWFEKCMDFKDSAELVEQMEIYIKDSQKDNEQEDKTAVSQEMIVEASDYLKREDAFERFISGMCPLNDGRYLSDLVAENSDWINSWVYGSSGNEKVEYGWFDAGNDGTEEIVIKIEYRNIVAYYPIGFKFDELFLGEEWAVLELNVSSNIYSNGIISYDRDSVDPLHGETMYDGDLRLKPIYSVEREDEGDYNIGGKKYTNLSKEDFDNILRIQYENLGFSESDIQNCEYVDFEEIK